MKLSLPFSKTSIRNTLFLLQEVAITSRAWSSLYIELSYRRKQEGCWNTQPQCHQLQSSWQGTLDIRLCRYPFCLCISKASEEEGRRLLWKSCNTCRPLLRLLGSPCFECLSSGCTSYWWVATRLWDLEIRRCTQVFFVRIRRES